MVQCHFRRCPNKRKDSPRSFYNSKLKQRINTSPREKKISLRVNCNRLRVGKDSNQLTIKWKLFHPHSMVKIMEMGRGILRSLTTTTKRPLCIPSRVGRRGQIRVTTKVSTLRSAVLKIEQTMCTMPLKILINWMKISCRCKMARRM